MLALAANVGASAASIEHEAASVTPATSEEAKTQNFALKTNLIYDALLMPNVELECRINNRWSLAAEADVAWWKNDGRHKYYQIMNFAAEGRYWFHSYKPWHGHYVGLSAAEESLTSKAVAQATRARASSPGCPTDSCSPCRAACRLTPRWASATSTPSTRSTSPRTTTIFFQHKSRTNYFGPVKVKFSLVWRFNAFDSKAGK